MAMGKMRACGDADFCEVLVWQKVQEGLAVASIVQDVVVEMTPPFDDNAW